MLLVEDEDLVREMATRLLRRQGYQVIAVTDGIDALTAFDTAGESGKAIDVLLTDMIMPRMGGTELAQLLREKRPDLPVVYMSGYVGNVDGTREHFEEGAWFLQKPFTAFTLLRAVREVIDTAPVPP